MWKYRKDYESIVITRLAFLRFYPPKPRVLRAYEHETRKHASPARVYLRNVCTRDVWLDIFLLLSSSPLSLSRSRSLAGCTRCLYYLKARIFSGYPTLLLPPRWWFAASLFLTIRENRGSVVVIVRVWVHTRTCIRARTRVATLVSSLLAKWPSPALACLPPRPPTHAFRRQPIPPRPANPQRRTSLSSYEACTILWD